MSEKTATERQKGPDYKVKIAASITGINAILTGIKFLLYYVSGSMAILAEAWHSFADIATSLFVFIALLQSQPKGSLQHSDQETKNHLNYPELFISLGIGIFLTGVGCALIIKFIQAEARPIENSLSSGLVFLVFSFVSYFIYRFETQTGEKESSIGLVSDGMHARADMIASLFTGFALILYTMGLDLDRWVAGLIAFFVLSFSIETITNVVIVFVRRDSEYLHRYRSSRVISILFDKESFQAKSNHIQLFIKEKVGNKTIIKIIFIIPFILVPGLVLVFYLSTSLFTVGIREMAVIERFGKPVNLDKPAGPGLHIKWPWPVDHARKLNIATIKELNIGNISSKRRTALLWTQRHGIEEPFLSGDNNFFYPYIVLHYKIKDLFHYLYKNADPQKEVKEAGYRIATNLFSQKTFYGIASTDRKRLEQDMFVKLQNCLDDLQSGIQLVSVNFKDIHPPISVADSFEKVIAAYQEKQKIINDALGYRYNVLPKARGNAAKELEEAKGYVTGRLKISEGKLRRFIMSTPATLLEKDLAMTRIHLHTIKTTLKDKKKIVIDSRTGVPDIWMDFEKLNFKKSTGGDYIETFSDN